MLRISLNGGCHAPSGFYMYSKVLKEIYVRYSHLKLKALMLSKSRSRVSVGAFCMLTWGTVRRLLEEMSSTEEEA